MVPISQYLFGAVPISQAPQRLPPLYHRYSIPYTGQHLDLTNSLHLFLNAQPEPYNLNEFNKFNKI